MPGGSRKGERRGGAKPRIVRKPKVEGATKRGFGTGVRQRGGSVVMQVTASGTYTPPTF